MSKVKKLYLHVLVSLIAIYVVYTNFMPIPDQLVLLLLVIAIVGWAWLPLILLQWYLWSEGK